LLPEWSVDGLILSITVRFDWIEFETTTTGRCSFDTVTVLFIGGDDISTTLVIVWKRKLEVNNSNYLIFLKYFGNTKFIFQSWWFIETMKNRFKYSRKWFILYSYLGCSCINLQVSPNGHVPVWIKALQKPCVYRNISIFLLLTIIYKI
jgi:hypothetical protein